MFRIKDFKKAEESFQELKEIAKYHSKKISEITDYEEYINLRYYYLNKKNRKNENNTILILR